MRDQQRVYLGSEMMSVKIKRLKNKVVDAVLHLTVTVMSSIMSLLYRLIKSAYSLLLVV